MRALSVALVCSLLGVAASVACSGSDQTPGSSASGGSGQGGQGAGQGAGTSNGGSNLGGNMGAGGDQSCAAISAEANLEEKPVDIIFAIGNNGSLSQEIDAVEKNINDNFASIIGASGIDYRVILVSRSGGHQFNICVEAPLGGVAAGECATQPNDALPVNNPPTFYHYSALVKNNDSWCVLLSSYDGTLPDEYGQAPNGWSEWLRPEAAKVFVVLSDSNVNCTYQGSDLDDGPQSPSASNIPEAEQAALDFDGYLLAIDPAQFGSAADRNYRWHSIVGLEAKDPNNATEPWVASDPLSLVKCTGDANVVSPALGYQAVSRLTGGLRFPICEWMNFDTVFNIIAQGIIAGAAVACEFPLPEAPVGQKLDLDQIGVTYTPTGGAPQAFTRVDNLAACVADAFYLEGDLIKLCPETCATVQLDDAAAIKVTVACKVDIN